jgi:hypothetical protein
LLRLPILLILLSSLTPVLLRAQSPNGSSSEAATRPAILGTLDRGKYSNTVIGFELQLDPACTLADEDAAISWSTEFSQRLNLDLRCGDNAILLSSFPLHADEKLDLKRDAQVSLEGAMDGGGFKRRGRLQSHSTGKTETVVQELTGRDQSGQELLGFYNAFMVGRRYVSIFAIGPKENEATLSQAADKLSIKTPSTQ